MNKVTNYIVSCTRYGFVERYILPEYRGRMNELIEMARKREYQPLLVVGTDGMWWNDELEFILDRMSDGCCYEGDPLYDWAKSILNDPLNEGESALFEYDGNTYTISSDTSDLSEDGVITNNCIPVDEDERENEMKNMAYIITETYTENVKQEEDVSSFRIISVFGSRQLAEDKLHNIHDELFDEITDCDENETSRVSVDDFIMDGKGNIKRLIMENDSCSQWYYEITEMQVINK